jgi:hypothetical protein
MGMAKRKYSKHTKIEPAVQTFTFANISTPPGTASANYIDLSQVASLVNRRFYRQGINWAVAGFKVLSDGNPVALQMNKLPNTWVMSNAWEKGFRTWQKMNREALAEAESIRPKFLDFKIYANAEHHTAGYGGNLLPQSGFGDVADPGEWEPSKYVIPDTSNPGNSTEREVIATGANFPGAGASGFNAVSLIEGYAASRGLPDILDPNTPTDADDAKGAQPANWMVALFNDGTSQDDAVIDDMISENNVAPYPFENGPVVGGGTYGDTMYPGGANQMTGLEVHDIEYVTGTTIGGTTRLKGGNFPCGLIEFGVINAGDNESTLTLQIDLVPGNHRGYLCESMTEM